MKIGHEKRDPQMSLGEQIAELKTRYKNFQFLFCVASRAGSMIAFVYEE